MTFSAALDLTGRHVVLCSGSAAVLGTITNLIKSGARVRVIAPEVATSVRDLAERDLITWCVGVATVDDLRGAALVVSTGEQPDVESLTADAGAALVRIDTSPPSSAPRTGKVILIGGGPGSSGLLTVAGLDAIRSADVIICDRLAPLGVLDQARPGAEVIDVGKIPRGEFTSQERINQLLVERASRGLVVARFKGGDNFVFGRGGEEWQACAAAGIPVEVIPGVSSAVAAPALAGIPLTHRQLTQGFTVVSAHLPPGDPGSTLDWDALARANTTLVILMGVATLPAVTATLIDAGMAPDTPAATIADAGLPSQRTVRGTVAGIAIRVQEAGIKAPAVSVIGAVAGFDPAEQTLA